MENSRRLLDRSRELGLKKPRLEEQKIIGRNSNARAFVQSLAEAASMRGRDSEGSDTTSRLGAIQELVSQYRTALAELTFNSKPIITNLTIIAGENLNAAKPIAAVICSNIIEVPTEQKLPSLYLLDSIVKNIGRDYIKYFAARLPEVFCKAYRQVDPAVHPGMRHLFGTWKNVFPPQSLQMIEKELGFPTAVSGSALGTATSKAVSQSQRPAQSIHVNPRYLEARERQQSSTVKGTINDMNGSLANSPDDTEKLERTTNVYSERRRADPRLKMHNIQHPPKNAGIELVQQKNSEFGTRDFSTELAKQSVLGIGKASDRVTEQRIDRAWYGSGSTLTGTTSNQSYGFDINLRQTNHLASRLATDDVHLQHSENLSGRSSIGMDRSWKNSEEEEYTWDDVNSRSTSYGVNRKSKRDPRFMDDSERLDSQSPRLQSQMLREIGSSVDREASGASLLFEQRNQTAFEKLAPLTEARATLGIGFSASDRTIPGHSDGHTTSLNGLSTNANSMIKTSLNSSINSSFQQSIHIPSLHKFQSDPIQYDPSAPSHKPVLSQISTLKKSSKSSSGNISHPGSEIPGQMSTSCLLTAVMESGILGKKSDIGGIPKLSCQTVISLPSQTSSRAAQPSDPPPTQLESKVASATLVSSLLHESTSVSLAQKETEQPPLPRKPPRSSIIGSASEETTTATSNPVSNLLNSLVSRGLISAAKTESSASIPLKNICDPHSQVQGTATASLMNSTRQVSSDILPSSTSKQLSLLKPTTETPVATHVSSVNEIKSHIGFEFKPEVIRVPHPVVISELLSDLPHRCGICGLRVRLKERFERHMEWHTLKKSDSDSSSKASRRWYVDSLDWVGEKVSTHKTSDVLEVSNKELENGDEQMVPADENHCVCVLCGELFEDLYNLKTDQWMFRGAVYLTLSTHSKITSTAVAQGPVVHASCISESSVRELGLANNVKVEEDA